MLLQRIQQQFIDSADLKYQCAQSLAPVVEAATTAVLVSVTGGGKVLACGNGASAAAAQHFAASFMGRYDRERPELAAFSLSADASVLTALATDFDARAVFARQVRALGQSGDVLLVLDGSTGQNAIEQAKQFTAATDVTGLVITKLDGTAKGGVVLAIAHQFQIPVKFIGVGEKVEDLLVFDKHEFADSLFSIK